MRPNHNATPPLVGRVGYFLLVIALSAGTAYAVPITTTQTLRMDFDLSGLMPLGPYDFLRTEFNFNAALPPATISVTIFGAHGEPLSATNVVQTGPGLTGGIGFETPLLPPHLSAGAAGFALVHFSQNVDLRDVRILGVIDTRVPDIETGAASVSLTVLDGVPEPSTTVYVSAGFLAIVVLKLRSASKQHQRDILNPMHDCVL